MFTNAPLECRQKLRGSLHERVLLTGLISSVRSALMTSQALHCKLLAESPQTATALQLL